jgi:mevalonate kinase
VTRAAAEGPPGGASPASPPLATASAPGKVILFGEHSVVYGEPAIAVAIDLRTEVTLRVRGDQHRVNGAPLAPHAHAHIREAIGALWKDGAPLDVSTASRIPSASGLGSSAALSVATVAALLQLRGDFEPERVAREAYAVEWSAQKGRGSPTDTTTVTHGEAVLVDRALHDDLLWEIRRGDRAWLLHHLDVPALTLVVGYTGVRGRTADEVAKVARFVRRTGFAREVIRDLGEVTRGALADLRAKDATALGERMDEAHNLLRILGVSHPRLDELCEAARRHAYGAKLTGSGGGGSMIALTDEPDACVAAIAKRGGVATKIQLHAPGVRASSS